MQSICASLKPGGRALIVIGDGVSDRLLWSCPPEASLCLAGDRQRSRVYIGHTICRGRAGI